MAHTSLTAQNLTSHLPQLNNLRRDEIKTERKGEKMENTQPEKKFRAGAISATVWKNTQEKDGKTYDFHSISLTRSYKDQSGAWKHAASFREQDLPKVKLVVGEAFKFLSLKDSPLKD